MSTTVKEIENNFTSIINLVITNHLKEALILLQELMKDTRIADFTLRYENIDQTYLMLLEYNFKGINDPKREFIYKTLKVSLLELADQVYQYQLSKVGVHIYQLKSLIAKEKDIAKEEAAQSIDSYSFESEFTRLLKESDLVANAEEKSVPQVSPRLFQLIWLTEKYTETDIQLVTAIRTSKSMKWHDKCLAVSAITLSLINSFDKEKFGVLCDFYNDRENYVWQRALTGLILALFIYNHRIELYPSILERLSNYKGDQNFVSDTNLLLLQMLKAKETEKLTTQFQKEILPDVQKFESKIREKLDIDNLLTDELIEDKNPDWEEIFEDNPELLNKIEKMSEMQMEGLDLFMGTFAMLKNFDFFREISNWFLPFYKENQAAQNAIPASKELKDNFLTGLEDAFYICNSDKYSFCFNLNHLPEEQSRNIISLFNMEAQNFREIKDEDSLLNKTNLDSYIFTQYIQDLYRFFNLHPFRSDFRNVFSMDWNLSDSILIQLHDTDNTMLNNASTFLFAKEHYAEASELLSLIETRQEPDRALLEKLGYCYQKTGQFHKAIDYFKKAELFETNRLWSLKKIVYCYRKLNEIDNALHWSLLASEMDSEDIYIQTMLGNCYLDKQKFELALEHYFKAEFLAPENTNLFRPISWCAFASGKLEIAQNYMNRLLEKKPNATDYINAGHIELCCKNRAKAMDFYLESVLSASMSIKRFTEILQFDSVFLIENGVQPNELKFIADYLRFKHQ